MCFLMPFSSNYRILKDFPQTGFQTTRRTRPSSSRAAEEQRHLSEGPSLGDCFTVVCLLLQICNYSVSNRRLRGRVCVCCFVSDELVFAKISTLSSALIRAPVRRGCLSLFCSALCSSGGGVVVVSGPRSEACDFSVTNAGPRLVADTTPAETRL